MDTIKDYLRWRGDIALSSSPFNVVDNVLLASLSYVDLRNVSSRIGDTNITLADAFRTILASGNDISPYIRSMANIDAELLRLTASSVRFGEATIRSYVDEVDDNRALQFSATTLDLAHDLTAVVFRGTDHSLVGWREDFLLGCKVTLAQKRATAYLHEVLVRAVAEGRRVVVCGHSKGGILAAYAACTCPANLRIAIEQVWSDDGPSMAPEVAPCDIVATLAGRYTHVVPEYSMVGMLFLPAGDPMYVVRSCASGFLQHDPTTWGVTATNLIAANQLSSESIMVADTLSAWLDGVDLATRERFVNELFDMLAAGNPDRIDAVLTSPAAVRRVLAATGGLSASTKGVARKLFAAAAASVATVATSAAASAASGTAAAVRSLTSSVQK